MEMLSISFQPERYVKRRGGTGANIAWHLALLGSHPLLIANIGDDGTDYRDELEQRGVDITYVSQSPANMTSTGVCCTDTREHQIWFFYRGADGDNTWPDIAQEQSDTLSVAIIAPRYSLRMLEGLRWCKAKGIPVIFDPGQEILQFNERELAEAVEGATGVIANAFEWELLRKQLNVTPEDIAKRIDYLIVTQGEEGHTIYTKEGSEHFPRCNCDTFVNPTGAGDAFRAGLLTGLMQQWSLADASKLGASLASFVAEQEGTQLPSIGLTRVFERAALNYGAPLPPFRSA